MRGDNQRPCKYGPNCFKLANNNCTFYHPPNQATFQPQMAKRGLGAGFHHNGHYNHHFQGNQRQNYHQHSRSTSHNNNFGNFNPHPNQSNYYPNHYPNKAENFTGKSNHSNGPKFLHKGGEDDAVHRHLCRNFHLEAECKFGENCRNKHSFMFENQDSIRRLHFLRNLVHHPLTKLTKFSLGEKDMFGIRNGHEVNFFHFNCETKALGDVFQFCLPDPYAKYNFYDHKNQFVYYSKENPDTHYEDIGFYDLRLQKGYFVANSHLRRVTGMAHLATNVIISTSISGELKVWILEGQQLTCYQEMTQKLKSQLNPQNANIQLYFVEVTEVQGSMVIAVGTSDGRLAFFFGESLEFREIQLHEPNSKVFRLRYAIRQTIPTAIVLTWNSANTHSSILEIDLISSSTRTLVETKVTPEQPKALMTLFEVAHGYLMVANYTGLVSIYEYPNIGKKIGAIYHQNQISDILFSEEEFRNTNVKMKTLFILEKRNEQKVGSLGIYLIK